MWLVVAVVFFYTWAQKAREKAMRRFARKELLGELTASFNPRRRRLKIILKTLALALCLIALIRPQWGFDWHKVSRRGLDIVIAIDTSKSMLAQDVKPNRLERSKLAVKDLVKKLKGDRIGLIAFSGKAFLQCPLTVDYEGFMLSLDDLSVNTIPEGGTSLSGAIRAAIKAYDGGLKKHKVLILITDGEDHKGKTMEAAKEAAEDGIKIFCVGIGTKEGELIPVIGERGHRQFLKDQKGNFIKTRLDEEVLQKIAQIGGGAYLRASGPNLGLDLIYEKKLSQFEKRDFQDKLKKQYHERFQVFLFLALAILVLEVFLQEN